MSLRRIARIPERAPSTVSREVRRNQAEQRVYCARHAQQRRQKRRIPCRPERKLVPGTERSALIAHMLCRRLSPEQISGKLKAMDIPNLRDAYVCRETIYNAIYPCRWPASQGVDSLPAVG